MTDPIPLLILSPGCRMGKRIALALAIKQMPYGEANLTAAITKDGPRPGLIGPGFPALVIGTQGAAGWVAALDLLEKVKTNPSLFPNNNRGMPIALSFWSEHAARKTETSGNFLSYADLIARQIGDGRNFLQGEAPGLADIESYIAVQQAREEDLPKSVLSWRKRMMALDKGVGKKEIPADEARSRLQALQNLPISPIDLER